MCEYLLQRIFGMILVIILDLTIRRHDMLSSPRLQLDRRFQAFQDHIYMGEIFSKNPCLRSRSAKSFTLRRSFRKIHSTR